MPYTDIVKQREYQRIWAAKRRANYLADKTCVVCGSTLDLEIDHKDPTKKISHRIWTWSKLRQLEELSKCQILCKIHHLEKTFMDMGWSKEHGKNGRLYMNGCRCAECVTTHATRCREWRERTNYTRTRS